MSFLRRRAVQGWLLVLPFLIAFSIFVIYPLIQTVVLSFSSGENPFFYYQEAFSNPRFSKALTHTAAYTVVAAIAMTVLSIPTAYLIQQSMRRHPKLRHLLSLPYAASMMAVSLTNLMFFNSQNGLLNKLMPLFNLQPQNWLDSPGMAFLCVLLLMIWRGFSYILFTCLLIMDTLPQEPYEAATIAGASRWQAFRYISLPQVLPVLGYVIPTTVIAVMTTFEPVLTLYYAGMNVGTTSSAAYLFYQQAFSVRGPGLACAIACLMLVPIMLGCFLYSRYLLNNKSLR